MVQIQNQYQKSMSHLLQLPLPCQTLEEVVGRICGELRSQLMGGWIHLQTWKSAPPTRWLSVRTRDSLVDRKASAWSHTCPSLALEYTERVQGSRVRDWLIQKPEGAESPPPSGIETWPSSQKGQRAGVKVSWRRGLEEAATLAPGNQIDAQSSASHRGVRGQRPELRGQAVPTGLVGESASLGCGGWVGRGASPGSPGRPRCGSAARLKGSKHRVN